MRSADGSCTRPLAYTRRPELARVVQSAAARRGADFGKILAPVLVRFVPRHPDAAFAVHRHGRVELRRGLGGHGDHAAQLAAVEGAQVDVVVAGLVAIPGDPGDAVFVQRDSRLPIVTAAGGNLRLRAPLAL